MREAAIVSYARTPIGRAFRGSLNRTPSPSLAAHAILHAVSRAGVAPADVDDVVVGSVLTAGTAGMNIARLAALAAGLPVTVAGQTIDRQCASGLMAISIAARQIIQEDMDLVVAAGQDNISAVQREYFAAVARDQDPAVSALIPHAYMPMLETAEYVARKYNISREAQDAYALQSQKRTAEAQDAGRFDDEIVPMTTTMGVIDKEGRETEKRQVTLSKDEGNRPETSAQSLAGLKPVIENGCITAGNASQLSDGAAACVVAERSLAERSGLPVLGIYRGMSVAGCAPEEMGIGPVLAVPKLLERHGLSVDDIGLWELNEAFACQTLYCRDVLGIDPDRFNVDGGAISIGHPYGMTGVRTAGHALLEGRRRGVKYVVSAMCVGGGMGAAALFEVA
ncbi:acetyl-CoA C-acyltransferase [Rhizobium laguerreae]|uniref:acetyl-CoA C-acyltransferase n=1 Tax=Rhizobium laguerreae TaxID=1076926 RepID=UPI001C92937D|nr:acetyl-CoA C-acyltransferase [Rhizobium laguerreae]MBY3219084.1 acetyl-CoA C-acyltransferase [Rhizobium laguerreae]